MLLFHRNRRLSFETAKHGHSRRARWRSARFEILEERRLLSVSSPAIELFNTSPALFVENQGQWADESVRYMHQGDGVNVAMTDTGPVLQLSRVRAAQQEVTDESSNDPLNESYDPFDPTSAFDFSYEPEDTVADVAHVSVHFDGANVVEPVGLDPAETRFNYFLGEQENWHADVPSFETVSYPALYNGIDLYTWGQRSSLKYEFHVAPGADYRQIQVSYEGIEGLWIDDAGALHVETALGELIDDAPYIYQEIDGQQVEVPGRFELIDADSYSFEVTGPFDLGVELVIDPNLVWSTYLGGTSVDFGIDIAVDSAGIPNRPVATP